MSKSEAERKLFRYCMQLEKYGIDESIHSPDMAMLRRKARKQMTELMKEDVDHSKNLNRLWLAGYYQPYQYFMAQNNTTMETVTLLTMFSGELHELLMCSDKYAAQLNLYIGDLHRYMPKDEIQQTLATRYYQKSIHLDPRQGRAYFALSSVQNASLAEKLRLLLLSQMAEVPYNTSSKLSDCLRPPGMEKEEEDELSADNLLSQFVHWALLDKSRKSDHQTAGVGVSKLFKKTFERDSDADWDWPMILSACRLASDLAGKQEGFPRFLECFDVLTDFYLSILEKTSSVSPRLLLESISWIHLVSQAFGVLNDKDEPNNLSSLSNFSKIKWNKLNDVVMELINNVFSSETLTPSESIVSSAEVTAFRLNGPKFEPSLPTLSIFVHQILALPHPTMELNSQGSSPLLHRINETKPKHLDVPAETIAKMLEKVNLEDRELWKPVYVIMDLPSIVAHPETVLKIWDLRDFISIVPSHVFAKIDDMKNSNRKMRPIIRAMCGESGKYIIRKECKNEVECAKELVAKVRERRSEGDHEQIAAVLCQNPEEQETLEGVSFYTIKEFYKKLLA